ncbi:uncharacterized protein LOC123679622 isoform X2 [Harmonia axyridis]|nr:uncharacterized protein LOC123679622 isoform X2 [Harmonia axyridis]XP_045472958.1 uncharacterized protein LOC123679622 isoform X2 [Harmonia axyridis]
MEKIGFLQFFIIESLILMGGNDCSPKINPVVRSAKTEAIDCIGNLSISGSFCDSLANDWMKCLDPLAKKVEECNQNKVLKGAIDISLKTTLSEAAFICKSDTADLLELANPCFLKSLELEEPCVNRFVMDVQSVFITQEKFSNVFCKSSAELEKCLTSTIEGMCPRNVTVNTIRGLYESLVKPCNFKKNTV